MKVRTERGIILERLPNGDLLAKIEAPPMEDKPEVVEHEEATLP